MSKLRYEAIGAWDGVARTKQSLSLGLSILLVFTLGPGVPTSMAYQATGSTPPASTTAGYPGQGAPATADELQSLVAPIALYPDALVAQILSAATFPDQVALADAWVQQNKTLTGSALATAVSKQTWDPSVKALTSFHPSSTTWPRTWRRHRNWARTTTTSRPM